MQQLIMILIVHAQVPGWRREQRFDRLTPPPRSEGIPGAVDDLCCGLSVRVDPCRKDDHDEILAARGSLGQLELVKQHDGDLAELVPGTRVREHRIGHSRGGPVQNHDRAIPQIDASMFLKPRILHHPGMLFGIGPNRNNARHVEALISSMLLDLRAVRVVLNTDPMCTSPGLRVHSRAVRCVRHCRMAMPMSGTSRNEVTPVSRGVQQAVLSQPRSLSIPGVRIHRWMIGIECAVPIDTQLGSSKQNGSLEPPQGVRCQAMYRKPVRPQARRHVPLGASLVFQSRRIPVRLSEWVQNRRPAARVTGRACRTSRALKIARSDRAGNSRGHLALLPATASVVLMLNAGFRASAPALEVQSPSREYTASALAQRR